MSAERHLLYDSTEIETLVFAPAGLAREVAGIREQAPQWETWGDARSDLSAERFNELRENQWGSGEPDDDEVLDTEDLTGVEPWPALAYDDVADWLPDEVVEAHGERYDGRLDSGIHLPADAEQEIIEALEALGYRCTNQHGLEELFDLAG
jgi:hypothetical protein